MSNRVPNFLLQNTAEVRQRLFKQETKRETRKITNQISKIEDTNLNDIRGVGEETIKKLINAGIGDKDTLVKVGFEKIKKLNISVIALRGIEMYIEHRIKTKTKK